MSREKIVHEVVYPHPPERVWRALTDREALTDWLMPNDFEPEVGHVFRFWTKPRPGFDGVVSCEVVEVVEPRRLSYTWQGGLTRRPTLVTFTLRSVPEGTRLRLEHSGFEGISGVLVRTILGMGWGRHLLRRTLPRTLARLGRDAPDQRELPHRTEGKKS